MQRPDIGDDIAPRSDFDLHAQARQHARHIGDGLLQGQIFAGDIGAGIRGRLQGQQSLGIGIEILDFFDDELGAGLDHFLDRATVDRTQDALAVFGGDIGRQFDLDLEDLLIAVFGIDNIVLGQTDMFGRDVARVAVQLDEVGGAQGRRGKEVVEGTRRRAIALVTDGLVRHHREIVELGFET